MDKNTLYPIISLLLVVLAAGAVYVVADMFGGTEIHHGEEHGEGHGEEGGHSAHGAEELFFKAVEAPLQHAEYTYAYEEESSTGYGSSVFLSASENYSYVRKEDAIFTRELFLLENQTILCLENVNRRLCSEVPQNSSFNTYAYTLEGLLFDRKAIRETVETNELFIEYGALVFDDEITPASYLGRECSEISYVLDYGKLTVEQMWDVGISPDSVEVLVSKEFNFSLCIDEENGDVLRKLLTYSVFGEPHYTESLSTQLLWGEPSPVEIPDALDDEEDMSGFYSALRMSQNNYVACLSGEDADVCIRSEAILSHNEKLCELIVNSTSKDICYVNVALEKGESSLCMSVGNASRDDCFMEFVWKYNDASYCDSVSEGKKEECSGLISESGDDGASQEEPAGEQQEPASQDEGSAGTEEPGEPAGTECASDADCVRAGCGLELCVPSHLGDVATACIWSPEDDCLQYSSCGCNNGLCGWAETAEYLECMEDPEGYAH
jgi:eight-cysteine-cluster-containing protein